jgi:FkbM family methyltransferase
MLSRLKSLAVSVLERHPYGYALGLAILESSDFFLPHEPDFFAMPLVMRKTTGLFLDIGANRGHSALGFHKVMPGWRTLSIEANPLHEARLKALKERNAFFDYRIAAADRCSGTTVPFWTPRYRSIYCHSAAAVAREEAVHGIELSFPAQAPLFEYVACETQTLALDDISLAPDIVKMDIQGKESDALVGLTKTIGRCRPSFLIECNLQGKPIFDAMRDLEYTPFFYDRAHHRLRQVEHLLPENRNCFFLPAEAVSADHAGG